MVTDREIERLRTGPIEMYVCCFMSAVSQGPFICEAEPSFRNNRQSYHLASLDLFHLIQHLESSPALQILPQRVSLPCLYRVEAILIFQRGVFLVSKWNRFGIVCVLGKPKAAWGEERYLRRPVWGPAQTSSTWHRWMACKLHQLNPPPCTPYLSGSCNKEITTLKRENVLCSFD